MNSRTDAGKCFTYMWRVHHRGERGDEGEQYIECPMHEEPLLLIPREARAEVLEAINEKLPEGRRIKLYGDVCPFCRKVYADLISERQMRYGADMAFVLSFIFKVYKNIIEINNTVNIDKTY